ncbi:MAG TPA: cytochrome c [Blastocatellia bacterium]|nr:cytochrome c [Blastocatellia bacterium]
MANKRKIVALTLTLGVAAAAWIATPAAGIGQHKEHEHSHAPASARKLKNPLTPTAENIKSGRTIYNDNCAVCHGEDGKAKTEVAATMQVKPADLTRSDDLTDGEIFWLITNGIEKSGMPDFKATINDQERWQTVLYVKTLTSEDEHHHGRRRGRGSKG